MGAEGTGSCELGAELGEPSFGETQGEPSWVAFNQNPWIKEIRTLWVNLVRGKGINMERGWSGARLVGSKIQDILPARCTKIHKIDLPNCPKDPPATNIFSKKSKPFWKYFRLTGAHWGSDHPERFKMFWDFIILLFRFYSKRSWCHHVEICRTNMFAKWCWWRNGK